MVHRTSYRQLRISPEIEIHMKREGQCKLIGRNLQSQEEAEVNLLDERSQTKMLQCELPGEYQSLESRGLMSSHAAGGLHI